MGNLDQEIIMPVESHKSEYLGDLRGKYFFSLQERIEYSKTFQGKYFNFLGYFFSIYCVWKIFMVCNNAIGMLILYSAEPFFTAPVGCAGSLIVAS